MKLCDDGHTELVYDDSDPFDRWRDCPACAFKDQLAESQRQLRDANERIETLETANEELNTLAEELRAAPPASA